ncbi:MAG: YbaB/EbfC family nucleoid-associated protein [Phycisphaeraceae bacterium]|nr:YbaB/EbfC family nucleoid-associated protein [Phycisphaeraceae bacterium]
MLDQLKAMGAVASLLKNREKLQASIQQVKEEMGKTEVIGKSSNGAVVAKVSGQLKVISVEISAPLVNGMAAEPKTREAASKLIADAVNDAMTQAQEKLHAAVQKRTQELGIPDLPGLGNLLG